MDASPALGAALGRAKTAWRFALDALLPPRCLACGAVVAEPGTLCTPCWTRVDFIAPPMCSRCGLPFEVPQLGEALCAACAGTPPPYERARAVFRYAETSRNLVLRFKHADATHAAPAYGAWLARAGEAFVREADAVAPVPLHRRRLFARRYNQAALLAHALGRRAGKPVIADLLVRRRATPSQGGLGREARAANVRGAFAVRPSRKGEIQGRRVLLVDDVLTTGATVEECARVLKRAGAAAVDVLTLARVARPDAL